MRTILLATAAALVIATPAVARDGSPYIGIEGGVLFPKSQNVNASIDFANTGVTDYTATRVGRIKAKTGFDVDAIAGYDFGMFRLEGELGYKRAKLKSLNVDNAFLTALNGGAGSTYGTTDFDLGSNHVSVLSGMVNGLVDFNVGGGLGVYAGAGVGRAKVKALGDSDNAWAYQLLAGVYAPISDNIDVGLKYRYFQTGNLNFGDLEEATVRGKFRSHSLLASLTFNFGGAVAAPPPPPPPPPPAPEAPATQTCPDGSVILATDVCPAPPPPPPPPPPPAPSGERGR
jgi:opacity protein-like surface antigen